MLRNSIYFFGIIATVISFCSCNDSGASDYNSLVKKELAKGTRSDSIFLGIYLGMSSKGFYSHCWEMNKAGLVTNGTANTSVLYKLDKGLNYPVMMNFYPDFYKDKIFRMRVSFEYEAWAPWNRKLYADSLLPDVVHLLEQWHPGGNPFMKLTDSARGTIYVKVDNNRRITVGSFDDKLVKVDYGDLLIEQQQKK